MKEQIVVSLTSWSKRIGNIPIVLDTIFAQTVQPDAIVINLSLDEFPTRELPANVQSYIDAYDRIRVNWVVHDTRVWKKFLPTLLLYPDALILPIDDDILYPPTMIEGFMQAHAKYPDRPISGNHYWYHGIKCHCGCASLVQAKHFEGWQKYYKHSFRISCPSSDLFYTYLAAKNGYFYAETEVDYMRTIVSYNEVDGYSASFPKNRLRVSREAIFNAFGVEVVRLFKDEDHRPFCVLGSMQTDKGKVIEEEMLAWLTPHFNVYLVRHDGRAFEYTAIKFLKDVMSKQDAPCFYLHTKGAFYTRKVSHRVRNMWRHEFAAMQDKYLRAVDGDMPKVACPYTGSDKVTWYNGWCANAAAIREMNLIKTDDRFYYEYMLFKNAEVVGLRMNNINSPKEERLVMHGDLRTYFD